MHPSSIGQIVKFHTVLEDENPEQLYVVLEINNYAERSVAKIKALNTSLPFPPISTVLTKDLVVASVPTDDLIGNVAYIKKSDGSKILGRITSVKDTEIVPNLSITKYAVETNVIVTIIDNEGIDHCGSLVVQQ